MRNFLQASSALLVLACTATGARAADGRIPVTAQTTLSQPGYYYLTRDIAFTTGVGIYIAANDVTLDLNGHNLSAPSTAGIFGVSATDRDRIRITNGQITGTYQAVMLNMSAAAQSMSVTVDHLRITNPGFIGINVQGSVSLPIHAVIGDNHILNAANYAMYLNYMFGAELNRNTVTTGAGIRLTSFYYGRAADNLVTECLGNGLYVSNSSGVSFTGNQVIGCNSDGIVLTGAQTTDNVLKNNISSRHSGASSGFVLSTSASGNVLDGNVATGNGNYGISLSTTGNIYSNNRLQASNNIGAGNFSAGGNNAGGANF